MKTRTLKVVQLVSGGLDSELVSDVYPESEKLFVDYGQKEAPLELKAVKKLWPRASVLRIQGMPPQQTGVYFPARNAMLATCAVMFAGADKVLMGGMADDNCDDKTEAAFVAISRLLSDQSKRTITVESPFFKIEKAVAVSDYLLMSEPSRLLKTFSCYTPKDGKACGDCPACFRWRVALRCNGVDVPPPSISITVQYLSRLHHYSEGRRWAILKAIGTDKIPVRVLDIDGVLTKETNGRDYAMRTPNKSGVDTAAEWHKTGWLVLHTSRREVDRFITNRWLADHGVKFHALVMDKMPCVALRDDKAEICG